MNKLNFTKTAIAALAPAEGSPRSFYYDDKSRGLCVLVSTTTKTFYLLRKVSGKTERIAIGRFPETTVEQARKRAGKLNGEIDAGTNPNELKRERRHELTLDDLHAAYLRRHAEVRNRRPDNAKNNYRRYLAHWGNRKLSDITRRDVAAHHSKLASEIGVVTANIALTLLRTMFNKAAEWELWKGDSPTARIQKFPEKSRERFIQPAEMPRFHAALRYVENETTRDFIVILLLTGARRGNAMEMRWRDVDFEAATWRIPETKNGEAHTVTLSAEALAVLAKRRKLDDGEFVFPGVGESGHLEEPKRAWAALLLRAELMGLVGVLAEASGWTSEQQLAAIEISSGELASAVADRRKALNVVLPLRQRPRRTHRLRNRTVPLRLIDHGFPAGSANHLVGRDKV